MLPVALAVRLWWAIDPDWWPQALDAAADAGVADGPLPTLLSGGDLKALGVPPGPTMGQHLRALREAQTAGQVLTVDDAQTFVRERVATGL